MWLAGIMMMAVIAGGWGVGRAYFAAARTPEPITLVVMDETFALIDTDSIINVGEEDNKRMYAKLRFAY